MSYNKLVRDKIIDKIKKNGEIPDYEFLNKENYILELKNKLKEETDELIMAKEISDIYEELADVLEVIDAFKIEMQISDDKLQKIKNGKALEKGAFDEKIYLRGVRKE